MDKIVTYTNFKMPFVEGSIALVVENGVVKSHLPSTASPLGEVIDLRGDWLAPAFVESHCHILPTGLEMLDLSLADATSKVEVFQLVRDRAKWDDRPWLLAVYYDQNKIGGEHITAEELDRLEINRPILLRHTNGHAAVCNTAALQAAGLPPTAKDPAGGEFGRTPSGNLNGVLLETAAVKVEEFAPKPSFEEKVAAILAAGESMAHMGIGCAADMSTTFDEVQAYLEASHRGCPIAMRLYPHWKEMFGPRNHREEIDALLGGDRRSRQPILGGIKLFSDGGISSGTAAIYGNYLKPSRTGVTADGKPFAGQLMYSPERLQERILIASEAGYQVAVHAIGDYALDLVMEGFERTGRARDHRLEHAMIASDAQIERLAQLGCHVAMQPEFLMRLGHAYQAQLGPERTSLINRTQSMISAGIRVCLSSDRPIVPGDPVDGLRCATDRPAGFDPLENISLSEAFTRYTSAGARILGDKGNLGNLAPGELFIAMTMPASGDPFHEPSWRLLQPA